MECIHNGYRVTGNHAEQGREYHVLNAAGDVIHKAAGKVVSLDYVATLPPGDVVEPEPVAAPVKPPKRAKPTDKKTERN